MKNWKFWAVIATVVIGLTLITNYIIMRVEDKKMSDMLDMIASENPDMISVEE